MICDSRIWNEINEFLLTDSTNVSLAYVVIIDLKWVGMLGV